MIDVEITTYGVLHGEPPTGNALVIDLRTALRNPHRDPAMRYRTGLDAPVREHVENTPGARAIVADATAQIKALRPHAASAGRPVRVFVFCKGGRHRSVAVAEMIRETLSACGADVGVTHRDIDKPVVQCATGGAR